MADIMETDPSSGFQSSDDEADEVPIESLVQGRAKRSTAGTHMSALIEAAADDDLSLLFAEVEDDNEFAAEAEGADDDDDALDSSSDDDDQGPNATNDYEGEQELQKAERKKRRAQNDLRFQTLRKRVKIDPTAVSSVSIPPRPKKKSERISWIPTVEDGPTRSSSRRQTMVNKEKTHARLKDSQEKRIRIIATMKEAEKRKAHLKPKEMTQEDHLEEAAAIERLNSKSLNRWEQAEKRKADERRQKIEALQNRRLEGPVMSYWSGLATWVNGRLTRVGKAEIKAKPEKETTKKKKSEKDEKTPVPAAAPAEAGARQGTPVPTTLNPNAALPDSIPAEGTNPSTATSADPAATTSTDPTTTLTNPATTAPTDPATTTSTDPVPTANPSPPGDASTAADSNQPAKPEKTEPEQPPEKPNETETEKVEPSETKIASETKIEQAPSASERRSSSGYPLPTVEIHTRREPEPAELNDASKEKPSEAADSMDIDAEPSAPKAQEAQPTSDAPATAADKPAEATSESTQTKPTTNVADPSGNATHSDTPAPPPLVPDDTPQAPHPLSAQTPHATQTSETTPAAPPENNGPAGAAPAADTNQTSGVGEASMQPEVPQPPPVIEHTGRNLTILENFDDRTAHSKKYSMYFNARKPPRLTKISSSLCVITSLPSRYRDPETSLPYANSYAYGQIRRIMSEGYIWSSMLGCFVGPAETAARGVPNRFLGKEDESESKAASEKAEKAPEPMEVDS